MIIRKSIFKTCVHGRLQLSSYAIRITHASKNLKNGARLNVWPAHNWAGNFFPTAVFHSISVPLFDAFTSRFVLTLTFTIVDTPLFLSFVSVCLTILRPLIWFLVFLSMSAEMESFRALVQANSRLNKSLKNSVVKLWKESQSYKKRIDNLEAEQSAVAHLFKKSQLPDGEHVIDEV